MIRSGIAAATMMGEFCTFQVHTNIYKKILRRHGTGTDGIVGPVAAHQKERLRLLLRYRILPSFSSMMWFRIRYADPDADPDPLSKR